MTRRTDPPEAVAVLNRHPGGYEWVITCPYCGRYHAHGGGGLNDDPIAFLGHRVSHCGEGDGYILVSREQKR